MIRLNLGHSTRPASPGHHAAPLLLLLMHAIVYTDYIILECMLSDIVSSSNRYETALIRGRT